MACTKRRLVNAMVSPPRRQKSTVASAGHGQPPPHWFAASDHDAWQGTPTPLMWSLGAAAKGRHPVRDDLVSWVLCTESARWCNCQTDRAKDLSQAILVGLQNKRAYTGLMLKALRSAPESKKAIATLVIWLGVFAWGGAIASEYGLSQALKMRFQAQANGGAGCVVKE